MSFFVHFVVLCRSKQFAGSADLLVRFSKNPGNADLLIGAFPPPRQLASCPPATHFRPYDASPGGAHDELSNSAFRIPHSAFCIPHSAFRILHSAFRILHSAFCIPHSAFRIPHSAFRIPHSAFRISVFRIPHSAIDNSHDSSSHYFHAPHSPGVPGYGPSRVPPRPLHLSAASSRRSTTSWTFFSPFFAAAPSPKPVTPSPWPRPVSTASSASSSPCVGRPGASPPGELARLHRMKRQLAYLSSQAFRLPCRLGPSRMTPWERQCPHWRRQRRRHRPRHRSPHRRRHRRRHRRLRPLHPIPNPSTLNPSTPNPSTIPPVPYRRSRLSPRAFP